MKAIVLTFDAQTGLAELVYKKYMELWPDCPLTFLIPYNSEKNPCLDYFRERENIIPVRTFPDIRSTMEELLKFVEPDEWVFWCIDDRYPVNVDFRQLNQVFQFLSTSESPNLRAVKLFKWKEKIQDSTFRISDMIFNYQQCKTIWGFYHHYFLKAGILRNFFLNHGNITENSSLRKIHTYNFQKYHVPELYDTQGFILPAINIIKSFYEPVREGKLTRTFLELLKEHKCHQIPDYVIIEVFKKYE